MVDAKVYGEALFLLAEEQNETEIVLADIISVKEILAENPKYCDLVDTPALSTEERVSLVGDAFKGMNESLVSLLKILCEKRALYEFPKLADAFCARFDESRNIERVTCITAVEMTEKQKDALAEKLNKKLNKDIIITNIVDPKILGGMKIRYGGTQLDGSLMASLEKIEKIVKETIVP